MKKTMVKRLMSWVLAAAMVVAMLPVSVMAAEEDVAQIGEQTYATLDEAIKAVADETPTTIKLLQDLNLDKSIAIPANKSITITADEAVTITDDARKGITLSKNSVLTIENVTFNTNGQIYLNGANGSLTFRRCYLNMDGEMYQFNKDGYYCCAISIEQPQSDLNFDGCDVYIENYPSSGSAIRWNGSGADSGYAVNITNGTTLTSTNCYSGFVGTCDIKIKDSTVNVIKHRGNGSNGSHFDIQRSKVSFNGNGSHGISAGALSVSDNSNVVSDSNGMYGIYDSGHFYVDGTSAITVAKNSAKGDYAGLKLTAGVTDGKVEAGAVVTITDNYCSGLSNNGVCVFEEGAKLTIMNNKNDKGASSHGGGIYNSGASAKLTLPSDAVIYNNHSKTDGDDIFNNTRATITFGKVGSDWVLDDCDHLIDGWYLDGEGARWQVCGLAEEEEPYAEEYVLENETVTVTGLTALKAAHGYDPVDKASYPSLDKKVGDDDEAMNDEDVDAAAGQKVNFQLTSNVPTDLLNYLNPEDVTPPSIDGEEPDTAQEVNLENRGAYVLTFHDVLDPMLTNLENYVVKIGDTELTTEWYKVLTPTDGCSFEISLDLVALYEGGVITDDDIEKATPITVTYDATLSEEAEAGTYENKAWVTAPSDWTTSEDIVYVNTYAIDIFKYDQADPTKGLEGAEFELYQKDAENNVLEDSKQTLTSNADGKILVDGLDAGTYYLKETKAPDGYVCSTAELTIVISEKAGVNNTVGVSFANSQIPHTGGTGTLMFTIGGIALMGTAGLLLVISRKKRKA